MKKVRKNYIDGLIRKYDNDIPFLDEEKGLFFAKDKDKYIACDNTTGDCWVEEFKHLFAVYDYLHTDKPLEEIQEEDKKRVYTSKGGHGNG